jgi:hypothetical protein
VLRDARDYQILFLALFLLLGLATRDWTLKPLAVGCAIATCLLTQWICTRLFRWLQPGALLKPLSPAAPFNWRSPLITSLGLSLLLRVDHLPTMALAGCLAITSKFVLRVGDKHFFNPANFGIVAVLLLTRDAWVSPGQWGEEAWYALTFLGAGGLVLKRVGRWDTTAAFLGSYAALEALRNLWLGWSWDVWGHRLMSGSLLLFALFMVTDPRAIPNARPARLIWAAAIALVTFGLRNFLYLPTAVFWALFALSPLTLLLDTLWAAPRFTWKRLPLKPLGTSVGVIGGVAIALFTLAPAAWAFCGFYVAKADTSLYNQASQVIIARDGNRTVLTMANDYRGDVQDFALVVPVPVVLGEDQVNVGDPAIVGRLDAFSAPRLVEYFDPDPCAPVMYPMAPSMARGGIASEMAGGAAADQALGVTVEASFSKGEYDIVILSARESDGLETWLRQNDYQLPPGASGLLRPYIRQGIKFFVARVNLEEFDRAGFQSLRPLQMAYESPRFMLPIRLGMVNAEQEQDLIVYLLTPTGQVEVTNYRTVKIPSEAEVPVFVKDEFSDFYRSMFQLSHQQNRSVAFLEYAWDMGWCDPCAANPLTPEELRQAGVFWTGSGQAQAPIQAQGRPGLMPPPPGNNVFITRLHVRYARDQFPEDLMFQETSNRENFQGRYILRHAFTGEAPCAAGEAYRRSLPGRFEREAQTLARLTGWNLTEIRRKLPAVGTSAEPWWRRLWR